MNLLACCYDTIVKTPMKFLSISEVNKNLCVQQATVMLFINSGDVINPINGNGKPSFCDLIYIPAIGKLRKL